MILKKNRNEFIKPKGRSFELLAKLKMGHVKDLLGWGQKMGSTFIGGEKSYPYKAPLQCTKLEESSHRKHYALLHF